MTDYLLKNLGEKVEKTTRTFLIYDYLKENLNSLAGRNIYSFDFDEGGIQIIFGNLGTQVLIEPFDLSRKDLEESLRQKILSLSPNFKLEEIVDAN